MHSKVIEKNGIKSDKRVQKLTYEDKKEKGRRSSQKVMLRNRNRTPTKMHDVTVESNIKTTPSTATVD